jgi:hypothetical protein
MRMSLESWKPLFAAGLLAAESLGSVTAKRLLGCGETVDQGAQL